MGARCEAPAGQFDVVGKKNHLYRWGKPSVSCFGGHFVAPYYVLFYAKVYPRSTSTVKYV